MIHEVPAQGLIDHGFLAYNPKMFRLLGESNGYATLFFDFRWTEVRGVLPIHIVAEIENYISTIGRPLCGISEAVLFVVQQKVHDTPFVPPLDVRGDAETPSVVIADRYWPASGNGRVSDCINIIGWCAALPRSTSCVANRSARRV